MFGWEERNKINKKNEKIIIKVGEMIKEKTEWLQLCKFVMIEILKKVCYDTNFEENVQGKEWNISWGSNSSLGCLEWSGSRVWKMWTITHVTVQI